MIETATTETELREAKVPWPHTEAELLSYIQSLLALQHDYGTCVYAMSMAAVATFNYVSHVLGVTGFQASCADLDIVRRTRMIDSPFALVKAEDMLYPQYDIMAKVQRYLKDWEPWAKEEAIKKLQDTPNDQCAESVIEHWQRLAALEVPEKTTNIGG